jgi:hypothetical protein
VPLPGPPEPEFPLPAKLTVTAISDGEGYSMIPDLCTVNIDIRLTPALDVRSPSRYCRRRQLHGPRGQGRRTFDPARRFVVPFLYHSDKESSRDYLRLSSTCRRAPRQAQIAVICLPRLAGAEQQRIVQNGDLVWQAGSDPARKAAGPLVGPAVFFEG